jgi:chromosome segregation ATPase
LAGIGANNEVIFAAIRATEEHLERRFEDVDRRLEHPTQRVDQTNQIMLTMDGRLGALTRAVEYLQRDHGAVLDTQAAQQRAIDALAARVAKLESLRQH